MSIENLEQLQEAVRNGKTDFKDEAEVYTRISPDGKLILFKYLETAVFANRWNFLERVSRGLILERATGKVIAYPFTKFWNYGENGRFPQGPFKYAVEKLDGSLGIIYWYNDRWNVATGGSFGSDQANWADAHLQSIKCVKFRKWASKSFTYMVEIIYPQNRIVVDYRGFEGFVLLGIRDLSDMRELFSPVVIEEWAKQFGLRAPIFWDSKTIDEALAKAKDGPFNEEGCVAVFEEEDDFVRFKIKGDEYLRIHKIKTGLTPRRVYEIIKETGDFDKFLMAIPEEFWPELKAEAAKITLRINNRVDETFSLYSQKPPCESRKEYAKWVMKTAPHVSAYLFKIEDGWDRERIKAMVTSNYERDFLE